MAQKQLANSLVSSLSIYAHWVPRLIFKSMQIRSCEMALETPLHFRVSWLKNAILADNCRLDEGSSGEGVVLSDNVTVDSNGILKPGSEIEPGTTVEGKT